VAMALWLLITVPYAIVRRRDIEPIDHDSTFDRPDLYCEGQGWECALPHVSSHLVQNSEKGVE
jgi:hypothetical protein